MNNKITEAARQGDHPTVIRLARHEHRWSQEHLARQVGCSQVTISNYERGIRTPSIADLHRLAQVLDLPPQTFGLVDPHHHHDEGGDDMRRRQLLMNAGLILAGIPLGASSDTPRRISPAHVANIRSRTEASRALIYQRGATHQFQNRIIGLFEHATTLVSHASGPLRNELLDAVGDVAGLAAYGYRDLGIHTSAQQWYGVAIQAAQAAGDHALAGHLVVRMAGHNIELHRPQQVLNYLTAAHRTTDAFSPGELSNQHAIAAWAYAQGNLSHRTERAIGIAEDHFANRVDYTSGQHPERGWQVRHTAEAELFSLTGAAYAQLAAHDPSYATEAITRLTRAIDLRDSSHARNATLDVISLAEAHLALHNLDQTAEFAHTAISHAEGSASRRVRTRISSLMTSLAPHKKRSDISEVFDHAHDQYQ